MIARFIIAGLLLILGLFAFAYMQMGLPGQADLPKPRSHGKAAIGGPFEAVSHLGAPFTEDDLKGHYSLLYFGFTYCPDICPAGLLVLSNALDELPEAQRKQVLPIFVSVDPQRDTPQVLKQYVSNFHSQLIGLTGTEAQIAKIAKAYKVYYQKSVSQENAEGRYLVDHSGYFYLMNPQGDYIAHFPHNVSMQALADALRSHIPNP